MGWHNSTNTIPNQFSLLSSYLNLDIKNYDVDLHFINRKNNWKNLKTWQTNFFEVFCSKAKYLRWLQLPTMAGWVNKEASECFLGMLPSSERWLIINNFYVNNNSYQITLRYKHYGLMHWNYSDNFKSVFSTNHPLTHSTCIFWLTRGR